MGQEFNGTAEDQATNFFTSGETFGQSLQQPQPFGAIPPTTANGSDVPGANGERYYTIQRVNGNGGNGKGDGVAGPHKHTLEESDRVKKNSIQRHMAKEEKEKKKIEVSALVRFVHTCCFCATCCTPSWKRVKPAPTTTSYITPLL